MNKQELDLILAKTPKLGVAVVGDFCVDAYWSLDFLLSERSVETGLATRPVGEQRYAPGGAGSVVNNLRAIGVGNVKAFGVVGADPFGVCLKQMLRDMRVSTAGLLRQEKNWNTHVYAKPFADGVEEGRIDFGAHNELADGVADALVGALEMQLKSVQIVVINEQIARGIHGGAYFRKKLGALIRRHPEVPFILDSRHLGDCYPGAMVKINEHEVVKLIGARGDGQGDGQDGECESISYDVVREGVAYDVVRAAAQKLAKRRKAHVVVTRGERGSIVCSPKGVEEIPGLLILGPVDTVGAGDSFLAGFAAAFAAGCAPRAAAEMGGFVAGVTVQKLHQTGTATPGEIRAVGADPDYVYRPELSDDVSMAELLRGTPFEIVGGAQENFKPAHVIFDHDGTISTLRLGWEEVMEPVMVQAVCGKKKLSAEMRARVEGAVRELIDKTTGIQTVSQMAQLVKLIRAFGHVPEKEISDAETYKQIYLDALMEKIRQREMDFRCGKTKLEDVTMRGAVDFLKALRQRGATLYLASGTDRDAVVAEAKLLGYAELFEGRIYGAERGVKTDAKKRVMQSILKKIGAGARVMAVGDGMVEMREVKKVGGLALGVASDEAKRQGLNLSKRTRLIRGGADIVIPDFAQQEKLLQWLGL